MAGPGSSKAKTSEAATGSHYTNDGSFNAAEEAVAVEHRAPCRHFPSLIEVAKNGPRDANRLVEGKWGSRVPWGNPTKPGYKAIKNLIRPSWIVLAAIATVASLQELAGSSLPFGLSGSQEIAAATGAPKQPEQGDFFSRGLEDSLRVLTSLKRAHTKSWTGKGANAHTTTLDKLIEQAKQQTDLDLRMRLLVNNHARCVSETQVDLGIEQTFLLVTALPTVCWLELWVALLGLAFLVAYVAALAALVVCIGVLLNLVSRAAVHALQASHVHYHDVTAAAQQVTLQCQQAAGH